MRGSVRAWETKVNRTIFSGEPDDIFITLALRRHPPRSPRDAPKSWKGVVLSIGLASARGNGVHSCTLGVSCVSPRSPRPRPGPGMCPAKRLKTGSEIPAPQGPGFQKWAAREQDGNAPFRSPEVSLGREENSVGELSWFARLRASPQPVTRKGGQKHPVSYL